MLKKLAIASVYLSLLSSSNFLFSQFDCEIDNNSFMLKSQRSTIISNDCEESKCIGKIIWDDGTTYSGSILNGEMHGKGTIKVPNQYEYEGEFKNGKKEGNGKVIFESGGSYEGEFINDQKNGFGALLFPCGYEYLGQFKDGLMHGEGNLLMNKNESFSGIWEYGKIQGQGTHFRKDGSQFIGEYDNNLPHGKGMIIWESKDTMRSYWTNGMIDDLSHFKFQNGAAIIQHWDKGKIKKKTIYVQENGFYISGSSAELAQLLMQSSLSKNEAVEDNFSLAWYIAAMEYKNQNDFEGATEQLRFAQMFTDPFEDTRLSNLLDLELEDIAKENEKTGVAQKNKKEKSNQ